MPVHELPPAALLLEVGLVFVRGDQLIGLEVERPQSRAAPERCDHPLSAGCVKATFILTAHRASRAAHAASTLTLQYRLRVRAARESRWLCIDVLVALY